MMYDLRTLTYRNRSLYRMNSQIVILDNENERYTSRLNGLNNDHQNSDNEEDVQIFTAVEHENNINGIPCEGICRCYEDNDRRVSAMLYRSRYSGIVLVSLLGFAVSKFVDNHIDECYEKAREVLSREEDGPLTCAMENVNCDVKSESGYTEKINQRTGVDENKKERKFYECNGHCWTYKRIRTNTGLAAAREMECEQQWAGTQIIEVRRYDNLRNYDIFKNNDDDYERRGYAEGWATIDQVRARYRKHYLYPFCQVFKTHYYYVSPDRNSKQWKFVEACKSYRRDKSLTNVKCKRIQNWE